MPIAAYETLFLLDVPKMGGDLNAAREQLHAMLQKYGCEIQASRPWGDNNSKMVYPVKGHKRGNYYLIFFKGESTKMGELEADLRIVEGILRYMIIHIHPKWVENMLGIAQDENQMAFKAYIDEPNDPLGLGGMGDRDGGERRSRRAPMEEKV